MLYIHKCKQYIYIYIHTWYVVCKYIYICVYKCHISYTFKNTHIRITHIWYTCFCVNILTLEYPFMLCSVFWFHDYPIPWSREDLQNATKSHHGPFLSSRISMDWFRCFAVTLYMADRLSAAPWPWTCWESNMRIRSSMYGGPTVDFSRFLGLPS